MKKVSKMRKEYAPTELREENMAHNPIEQFQIWFEQATQADIKEPNAMALATATRSGLPSCRMVLLKGYDHRGFVFYSNYMSRKGIELEENPHAALLFWWEPLERQVRIEGTVVKTSAQDSDAYFATRPRDARLGAIASEQSTIIPNLQALQDSFEELEKLYPGEDIPRPDYWGGYCLQHEIVEFWQGGSHRLHSRLRYSQDSQGQWQLARLSP